MPDSAGSKGPKEAVPHPGLSVIERAPQGDFAGRNARREWIRPGVVENEPGESLCFRYGDLIEGSVAVAALLAMVAIGVTPWLAIPLSVVTYIAVRLLRPAEERRVEMDGVPDAEQPSVEAIAGDRGHTQFPDEALTVAGAVTAHFRLTRREQEILPLLAQRLTDREIAERLSISHRTAMNHTANILGKLGLASRRDVAAFVAQHGLPPASTAPHEIE